MKTSKTSTLIARIPDDLMKKIDATAKKSGRTRSSEARLRLEESLKRFPVIQTTITITGAPAAAQQ